MVVIEKKYGDGALKGDAGMKKHLADFQEFKNDTVKLNNFKTEMLEVFKQKRELGLIPDLNFNDGNKNEVVEFSEGFDLLLLIANHDPASVKLQEELKSLNDENVKLITSNFMGYGLFKQNVFSLDEFLMRFSKQIYSS